MEICDQEFGERLHYGVAPKCPKCYPVDKGISSHHWEILAFLESINIESIDINNRSLLDGKELDILIPNFSLAIEVDGLYWHSEERGIGQKYHLNKTIECLKNGIQLIHIFEDEWLYKKDIVKSIILNKVGKSNKIYARKCSIYLPTKDEKKEFLDDNHIQGTTGSNVDIGLKHNNELVSILTMGPPRFNKNYQWEILRSCSKINTSVVGGISKLFKYFVKTYKPKSVITYADRRYGEGLGYLNCNFSFINSSDPAYWYLKNNKKYHRTNFQKGMLNDKLNTFDDKLSEGENMRLNGYDRIWDCGTNVYGF